VARSGSPRRGSLHCSLRQGRGDARGGRRPPALRCRRRWRHQSVLYVFEAKTVQWMELLVLSALGCETSSSNVDSWAPTAAAATWPTSVPVSASNSLERPAKRARATPLLPPQQGEPRRLAPSTHSRLPQAPCPCPAMPLPPSRGAPQTATATSRGEGEVGGVSEKRTSSLDADPSARFLCAHVSTKTF
jgi:hypothetical protein